MGTDTIQTTMSVKTEELQGGSGVQVDDSLNSKLHGCCDRGRPSPGRGVPANGRHSLVQVAPFGPTMHTVEFFSIWYFFGASIEIPRTTQFPPQTMTCTINRAIERHDRILPDPRSPVPVPIPDPDPRSPIPISIPIPIPNPDPRSDRRPVWT